jgi:hypothetical protein
VAAAISSSGSHFGGIIGHSFTSAVTLRGCVFSGSLSGGTCVATFHGWSDDGAATTLIDCLDASASTHPIGRGADAACVSNTYYLASKDFGVQDRLWSEGKRGKRAYAVTGGDGVTIDFGAPAAAYNASGITAYGTGLAYRGSGTPAASSGTFYATQGESVPLLPSMVPPFGSAADTFAASAGELTQSDDAWVLTMPAGDVVVSATGYALWSWQNGVAGAWDATDASGIHNVFRYAFNVPAGAFTNSPLLDIAIEGGSAVVKTPPAANTADFVLSVVESSDVAGAAVTRRKPLDAAGRTVFPMEYAASRFYRLSAIASRPSTIAESGSGVQLWADGPYWAETNVGADEPWESGLYFWWGDTVGYRRENDAWAANDGSAFGFSFEAGNAPTHGWFDEDLQSEGWITADGVLASAHDAAYVKWGGSWRMPTDAEHGDLINNCDWTWTTKNGVNGYEVRGRGKYASASIFLPCAGYGDGASHDEAGDVGYYWSSTLSHYPREAWGLDLDSHGFRKGEYRRYNGIPVRPVRDAD